LSEILFDEGYQVHLAENAAQARAYRKRARTRDLVLLDIWMPDTDGVTLLKEWVEQELLTMAGHHDVRARHDRNSGRGDAYRAVDFLEKPIAMHKLLSTIADALKTRVRISVEQSANIFSAADGDAPGREMQQIALPLDLPLRERATI